MASAGAHDPECLERATVGRVSDIISQNLRPLLAVFGFALFWSWETWRPFMRFRNRGRHAIRNVAISLLNAVLAAAVYAGAAATISAWTAREGFGLLNMTMLPRSVYWVFAFLALDLSTYLWHRLNHVVPLLWRFHRVHHSDQQMDVSTATRFHPVEIIISWAFQLCVMVVVGIPIEVLALHGLALIVVTQLHHADVALPAQFDRALDWVIVSPNMHKIHHSRVRLETDSNFSSVLSIWDRLLGSFRRRADYHGIRYGIEGQDGFEEESFAGLLADPFRRG